ncbi:MAG: DUF72 domain-containing protein [Verrucomicrobia bacterium]|nr:MAG: DUF72 domain-containing protein [Verrucomicrobiota bacterium]
MSEIAFDRERMSRRAWELARRGVWVGTSSWKYPGWMGQVYDRSRYVHRGRFSESRFNRLCLREYAEVFPTVCVDAAYYKFPDETSVTGLMEATPPEFRFAFKVTDEITIKRFPRLDRFGERAGQPNPNFLNADLFATAFLGPFAGWRDRVALFLFEFSRFWPGDFERGRDFVAALDRFLGELPSGWPYGVEIRNRTFLHPEYFATLARHGVTHVLNNWDAMPSIEEQLRLEGVLTRPDRVAARFLLRPGRRYQQAVDRFSPYDRVQEPNESGRRAGATLIREGLAVPGRQTYLYVNNRFEGNAPGTITAMLDRAGVWEGS